MNQGPVGQTRVLQGESEPWKTNQGPAGQIRAAGSTPGSVPQDGPGPSGMDQCPARGIGSFNFDIL